MNLTNSGRIVIVVGLVLMTASAKAVTIGVANLSPTPSNCEVLMEAGGLFTFDLVVVDAQGFYAQGFQANMGVSGPGTLTGDAAASTAAATDSDYWMVGNSAGAEFIDNLDDSYTFGDNPNSGIAELLENDDIMARYAFVWDGTEGDYTFTLNADTNHGFLLNGSFIKLPFVFSPGEYQTAENSFTVHIVPEPATVFLLGLGSFVIVRKRKS